MCHPKTNVAILGPSGRGKSTQLRRFIGMFTLCQGEVLAGGEPLVGVQPHVALIYQSFAPCCFL